MCSSRFLIHYSNHPEENWVCFEKKYLKFWIRLRFIPSYRKYFIPRNQVRTSYQGERIIVSVQLHRIKLSDPFSVVYAYISEHFLFSISLTGFWLRKPIGLSYLIEDYFLSFSFIRERIRQLTKQFACLCSLFLEYNWFT